jgi:hypothetical protein
MADKAFGVEKGLKDTIYCYIKARNFGSSPYKFHKEEEQSLEHHPRYWQELRKI